MSKPARGRSTRPDIVLVVPDGLPPGAVEAVASCATAEVGTSASTITADELQHLFVQGQHDQDLVVVDAGWLTMRTVYGDLAADPRPGPAVLTSGPATVGARVPAGRRLWQASTVADLAEGLRAQGPVRELSTEPFPCVRIGGDLDAALAQVEAVDEADLRLRRASRSDDGFLSTFLVRPLSRRLTRRVVRTGVAPATVTAVSLALGLGSAAAYGLGGLVWTLVGSALLLCSLVVDCVDGEVARYTRTFSALGAWLDVGSDRVKEYAVYAGLVVGAARVGEGSHWWLALTAMAVLVVRHFVDFGFAASPSERTTGSTVAAWSEATTARSGMKWAKRAVIMPVGERTLVLIVLAPLLGTRWTLWVLVALGVVAGAYTTAGRLARAWHSRGEGGLATPGSLRLVAQADAAPLPARALVLSGRFGWLVPAVSRALELAMVLGAAALAGERAPLGVVYAYLAVAALRDYDIAYRVRLAPTAQPCDWLSPLGWPVRAVVGAALLLAAPPMAPTMLLAAAAVFGAATLVANVVFWRRDAR